MKLTFETLTPDNFGSFYEPVTLDFSLLSAGLYFQRGRNEKHPRLETNGVGKTTLWRALIWALYGRTPTGLRGPDLLSWRGKKSMAVTVTFLVDDDDYKLTRKHNPNKIILNGKDCEQADVDDLIRMSMETFCNAVVFPQGGDLFLDLPPGKKLQTLTDAINLDRWADRAGVASERASGLAADEGVIIRGEATLKGALDVLDQQLKDAKARSAEWEADRQARLKDRTQRKAVLTKELEAAERRLSDAKLERDSHGVDIQETRRLLDQLRPDVLASATAINTLEQREVTLLNEEAQLKRDLKSIGETDECPTCGQSVKGTDLAKHKAEIKKRLGQLDVELQRLDGQKLDQFDHDDRIQAKVKKFERELEDAEAAADKAEAQVNLFLPQVAELRTELSQVRSTVEQQQDEHNPYGEDVRNVRRQIGKVEDDLKAMEDELVAVREQLERTKYWVKGFRDVQLYIIEEILQEVEATCNSMLPDVGLDGWEILFHVEHENKSGGTTRGLNVSILSPDHDKPVRWECWSGGEGQRLRVVAALGLAEVLLAEAGVQPNIEVLDEPTQHMSGTGTRDLCAFLADRAEQLGVQTFWVDHHAVESNHFSGVLTVVKDAEGSFLEWR